MTTGIALRLDDAELRDLLRRMADVPDLAQQALAVGIHQGSWLLAAEAADRAPNAAGTLAQSIFAEEPVIQAETVIGVVGSPLAYAGPVELGSRPHTPPLEPIKDWVELKLGLRGEQADSVAQAIRWKIRAHGTKPRRMFANALNHSAGQIREMVADALRQAFLGNGWEPMA
ncbi:hypothetical protein [Insolitispirillum peregrinum]